MATELIPTKPNDFEEIAQLACRIWHDHYIPIIGEKQVNYMLEKLYSYEALMQQVNEGKQEFYFILENNRKIGFVAIRFENENKELFIHKFYILTTNQKKGIGSRVLKLIENLYPMAHSLKLTVNRQNFKSINFYFKNGFIIQSVKDFDIGNGYFMNDFVMVKHSN